MVRYYLVRPGLKSAAYQLRHLSLKSATILPFSSSLPLLCIGGKEVTVQVCGGRHTLCQHNFDHNLVALSIQA